MRTTAYTIFTLPLAILISSSTVGALPKHPFIRRQDDPKDALGVLPYERNLPVEDKEAVAFEPALYLGHTYDMTSVMPLDPDAVSKNTQFDHHRWEVGVSWKALTI